MKLVLRGGAEVTALVLATITTLWVSRIVGPSLFGYYVVMVTVVSMGALLINAGLTTAGAQRIANDPGRAGEVAWVTLLTRGLTAVVAIAVALMILAAAPIEPVLREYLRVGLLVWALIPIRHEWALVAQGRVRAISMLRVAGSAASLLAAILLIRNASDADRVAWIQIAGAFVTAAGSTTLVHRSSPFRRPAVGRITAAVREYLRDGRHYLKSDLSVVIFTGSDRLFLYAFATPAVVGLYAAAYSLIQPFYMISTVLSETLYLPLAQAFGTDRLQSTFRRYVDLMSFATIPLGFFLLLFAPTVISILYGPEYAAAADYLAILGWVITFGYTSGIAVVPFSAWNRPREYGNATAIGGAVNLALNVALIPTFQGFGAAWATVAAKVAVTLAGIRYFRRATSYPLVRDFAEYLAISAGASVAALATSWILPGSPVLGMLVFGLVYVALVAVVRWRPYGPVLTATGRSLLPGRSGIDKQSHP